MVYRGQEIKFKTIGFGKYKIIINGNMTMLVDKVFPTKLANRKKWGMAWGRVWFRDKSQSRDWHFSLKAAAESLINITPNVLLK